jgi:hypothetical protein
MEKPYLKKIKNISGHKVFLVDGQYIRNKIDEEFTNFGQTYRFPFIPKGEFWIDREAKSGEDDYYIEHMIMEEKLMAKGMSYTEAIEKANKKEKVEREKSVIFSKLDQLSDEERIKKIHKKILCSLGRIKVWLISGEAVRSLYFIDFTEGGHDKVYHFVPANEVWIDDDLSTDERDFVLLHELHERRLMAHGANYNEAHYPSSALEHFCRHHHFWLKPFLFGEKLLNLFV